MERIKVYTSSKDLKLKRKKVNQRPVEELKEELYYWAMEQRERMAFLEPSPLEELFLQKIDKFIPTMERQTYFNIDGKSYFLDFLLPKYRIAIEIDGNGHRFQRDYDKDRDKHFKGIGIKTVRFSARQINSKNFRDGIFTPAILKCLQKSQDKKHGRQPKNKKTVVCSETPVIASYIKILHSMKSIKRRI